MKKSSLFVLLLAVGCLAFPQISPAPLNVRQGEGVTYTAPGAEDVPNQKDAQSQFDAALAKETSGSIGAALSGYRKTVRRFPKSTVAPTAQYKLGALLEKRGDIAGAGKAYEQLIVSYPHSTDFNNALEGEFRIANAYLDGARIKVLGIPTIRARDKAITSYGVITHNAPFSRWAPLAQFNIGQAFERQGDQRAAINAYQAVVDRYPTEPAAADAQYQIGFLYMQISRSGINDRSAAAKARESFEDFVAAYPTHEKTPQAKENLASLTVQQTGGSLKIADYYYKQQQLRAAVVYYNDVIRQQPNSPESEKAKARLDTIRAKYGDKYFVDRPAGAPGTPGAVAPKVGDGRLQAQTDTARRPDYVGPPVSAPTPPPPPPGAEGTNLFRPPTTGSSGANQTAPAEPRPEPTPPIVPPADQPTLPAQ